ncbi:MAG: MFS transporter, partial [Phycicoccus sp.]
PAWTTVVPSLVEPEDVGRVLSVQQALRGAASPVGAALGGLLVQSHGAGAALAANSATFLVLAAGAARLPARRTPRSAARAADDDGAGPSPGAGGGQEVHARVARIHARVTRPAWTRRPLSGLDGWRHVVMPRDGLAALRARPVAWVLVLALLPFIVVLESVNVVEVFLVRDVLGASPVQYGAADAVHAASAIVGALAAGTVTMRHVRVRLVIAALFGISVAQVAQGLVPTYPLYVGATAVSGALLGVVNALVFAVLLAEVERARHGSAVALVGGLSRTCSALALLLGGTLTSTAGPRVAYVVAGGSGLVVAMVAAVVIRRSVDLRARHGGTAAPSERDRVGPRMRPPSW